MRSAATCRPPPRACAVADAHTRLTLCAYVYVAHGDRLVTVGSELDSVKPTHVLNAAGLTGRPNVDWCESHKVRAAGGFVGANDRCVCWLIIHDSLIVVCV